VVRRPVSDVDEDSPLAALMADHTSGRSREQRRSPSPLASALRVVEARIRDGGGWTNARELVGLYAWCHRSVYKVLPVELEAQNEFSAAARAATSMLHAHFDDDMDAAVAFVKWAWQREKGRADWARREKKDRNRMGWRLQFSPRHVTDYRVAQSGRG